MKFFFSVRKDLLILFFLSITTILAIDFWLINIPEVIKGGAIIGKIIYRLCLSFISAFIFYFLVIHIKSQKDKDTLYTYIAQKVRNIIGNASGLLDALKNESGQELKSKYPTKQELERICKNVNPMNDAPIILDTKTMQKANWYQYMKYYKSRNDKFTNSIYTKINFLESELVKLIAEIEDCSHFNSIEFVASNKFNNQDLSTFSDSIYEYLMRVQTLDNYHKKHLMKYNNN